MPIKIIDDCISCGACQAECPNDAIYEGGVDWELKGETHPAKSDDHFYVATDKCTECVGFFDEPQCASVCPTDSCQKDESVQMSHDELMARKVALHS
ncbi:MAG: 4Fe-4S dicluster domain-containing protein [Flavobacteriales bacterium]|jgi:4Fe-4S ferredoxin iron-sulfur binding domain protein|nr:4Fe-4S dicluster domain-containing protein [Flavobacteriales bacterium]PWM12291.1 MAG: ferredoxin [Flavobacteriales bacterium]